MDDPTWVKFHQQYWHRIKQIHNQIVITTCGRDFHLDMCMLYYGETAPSCDKVCSFCTGTGAEKKLTGK